MAIEVLDPKSFEFVDAQLSEVIWHTFSLDPRIQQMSRERFEKIVSLQKKHNLILDSTSNILEIAGNNHITSFMLANKYRSQGIVLDISKEALSQGRKLAREAFGEEILDHVKSVAGDFHHLPFESGFFDFVFVSHAVHHTNRPELLIQEMLRVLKPNGFLLITEEPVKRELSLYQFNVNRKASFTPFESSLFTQGVLGIVAYPGAPHGSRPEELFGMIENYKIPLKRLRGFFTDESDMIEEWVTPGEDWALEEGFDRWFLRQVCTTPAEIDLRRQVEAKLKKALSSANALFSPIDELMGFAQVNIDSAIDLVIAHQEEARMLASQFGPNPSFTVEHLALFGGGYGCLVRRRPSPKRPSPVRVIKNSDIVDMYQDPLQSEQTLVDISSRQLPDIQTNEAQDLSAVYSTDDWHIFRDKYQIQSCINKQSLVKIKCGAVQKSGALLCRYYGVFEKEPYRVVLKIKDMVLGSHTICASETRLFKVYLHQLDGPLEFELQNLNGELLSRAPENRILVGILQYYPLLKAR